jgi:hypothetical protein
MIPEAAYLGRLALDLQRALDGVPVHPIDPVLRRRAASCWSQAENLGLVIQ